jgi:hypothetical protein
VEGACHAQVLLHGGRCVEVGEWLGRGRVEPLG